MKNISRFSIIIVILVLLCGCTDEVEKEEVKEEATEEQREKWEEFVESSRRENTFEDDEFLYDVYINYMDVKVREDNYNWDTYTPISFDVIITIKEDKNYDDMIVTAFLDENVSDILAFKRLSFSSGSDTGTDLHNIGGSNTSKKLIIGFTGSIYNKKVNRNKIEEYLSKEILLQIEWKDGSKTVNVPVENITFGNIKDYWQYK